MPVREGIEVAAPRRAGKILVLMAILAATLAPVSTQTPLESDVVAQVRAAMAVGGLIEGEKTLAGYRGRHGSTPETVEALLWLARGALAAKLYDKANQYAREAQNLALNGLDATSERGRLQMSIGMAAELLALVMVEQGARSDAVYFLRRELQTYADTPAAAPMQSALHLLSLKGQSAPVLNAGMNLGPRLPDKTRAIAGPTLVFFWAHWCQECKAEGPMLEALSNKYRERGLAMVAPTRRYGYLDAGRPAAPDKELQHIVRVRDTFYRFLKREPVPVTESNHKSYGVSVVPVHVLIDRQGMVRLYHPGRIGAAELEAAIVEVLER